MSFNNEVKLVGNLGDEPEMRYTNGGVPVLSFRMATKKKWTDKAGAAKEETQWHSVCFFGDRAAECMPHLHKGSYVRVEGEVTYEQWEKDGVKQYSTKIRAESVGPAAFPRSDQNQPPDAAPAQDAPYRPKPNYGPPGNQIPFGAPPAQSLAQKLSGDDFNY